MAPSQKSRTGSPLILALAAVGLLTAAGVGVWFYRDATREETPPEAPRLPAGRLEVLTEGVKEIRLLALDEIRRDDKGVEARVLVIGRSPTGLDAKSALQSQKKRVECATFRVFDENMGLFDADGRLMSANSYFPGRRGRPADGAEAEVTAVCGPAARKSGKVFADYRAAQRDVQTLPDGYEAIVAARPQDPHAWAWLCSAGARGRWRNTTPGDCDKAVELNPNVPEVLLDRGYLSLKAGKNAAANADFAAVLARHPDYAPALFSKGLLAELRGDKAASRRDRLRALDLDSQVPLWLERRYGVYIGAEYRAR